MLKLLRFISRLLVGATFIFSGFVKAVDPVGGSIKFHDYFQAFNMDWLMSLTMPASVALASLEFIIGVLLVFNIFPKIATRLSFYFLLFFTILTLGLAIFNPVTDCGCFGDAIKLTNWETFWKNIVILAFASLLFFSKQTLNSPCSLSLQRVFTFLMVVYILGISIYSFKHLPLLDFRPYSIGSNISAGMTIPEDAPQPQYKTTFILKKDGVQKEFNENNYPYEDTTWVFVDSKTELISEGYTPPIHDFVLQHPERGDITDQLLNMKEPLWLVVSPKTSAISEEQALELAQLNATAGEDNIPFFVVTASTMDEAQNFNEAFKTNFDFLQGDETNLKTIIRSNPGLLLLQNGTVTGKWHYNDLPAPSELTHPLSMTLKQLQAKKSRNLLLGHLFLIVLVALIILKSRKTINKNQ
ncbi:DoxX family protein [Marinilabilia rubra]|uniref:DoxX family protein n=2 Tax=Marinilabilia rubra TaxID=2162893 RepID=A0A2U2B6M1_9BACT|nr:DoxX family protein [Marinilabilia rubra]